MKYFIGILLGIGLILVLGSFIQPTAVNDVTEAFFPEPNNYIVDSAGVLSNDNLDVLNSILKDMDNDRHQIAIAIIKTTEPLTIEEYGIQLAEKWKVGNSDKDDGLIIIIATEDRKVRLEIGYGLEGELNDAKAGELVDEYMIPQLKDGNWYQSIVNILPEISKEIE